MFGIRPNKHSKMASKSSEETREKKLENKIFALYHSVFLGIYRVNHASGPSHLNRLVELFVGAGMSSFVHRPEELLQKPDGTFGDRYHREGHSTLANVRVLQPLCTALTHVGPRNLKLFDGLGVASLEAVIELLEAYDREIASVGALYQILRGLQVGYRMPTEDDEKAVLDQFVPVADQLARRILHLDARLDVLVSRLGDEFWNDYGPVEGQDGWFVHDILYPSKFRIQKGISGFK